MAAGVRRSGRGKFKLRHRQKSTCLADLFAAAALAIMTTLPMASAGRFSPLGPRGILYDFKAISRQFRENGLGDMGAVFRLNPLIVQMLAAIALGVTGEGFVDSANNDVFRCFGRHFVSCFALSIP
jgi:hypothetical protein